MSKGSVTLILVCILTFFVMPAASQRQVPKTKSPTKTKAAAAREAERLRIYAVSLLYGLAQSGNEIDSIPERVLAVSEIGDALWSVDQDYARSILVQSFHEIDKLPPATASERGANQTRSLRRTVLSRIARHDPVLANQLIRDLPKETPTTDEKARRLYGVPTAVSDALLGIAQNLLSSDSNKAAALAAYSLQDGLSQRLRLFLMALRAKDRAAADSLVEAALRQASDRHPAQLFDVMILWDYVYQPESFYLNGISWEREPAQVVYKSSPVQRNAVLQFAVAAIIENLQQLPTSTPSDKESQLLQQQIAVIYDVIQQLLPSMQADYPPGSADLQQALAKVQRELLAAGQKPPEPPEPSDRFESPDSLVDRLLEKAAAAAQGDGRDSLYLEASFKLLQTGKFERAAEISTRVDDLDRRSMLLDPINFLRARELAEKNILSDALSFARRIRTPELQIDALAHVGAILLAQGELQGNEALYEAQSVASKADPSMEVSAATLHIAAALLKNDPMRAAETIGLAIQIANKAKDNQSPWPLMFDVQTDPLSYSWKNAPGGGLLSVQVSYARNGGLRDSLSKLDFDQALTLAKGIKSKGFSLAIQAAICRTAIAAAQGKTSVARY